jgi:hypothetical protein
MRTALASGQYLNADALLVEMQKHVPTSYWVQRSLEWQPVIDEKLLKPGTAREYEYDVAISYAGEVRSCASELANALTARRVRVFYDEYELARVWGQDLYTYLIDVYQHKARFCVMIISRHYIRKRWTNLECKAAQARALDENTPYILPVKLDDTEVPGVLPTVAYLSWQNDGMEKIVKTCIEKLRIPDKHE